MNRTLSSALRFKILEISAMLLNRFSPEKRGFNITRIYQIENLSRDFREDIGVVLQGPILSIEFANSLVDFVDHLSAVVDLDNIVISTWDNEYSRYLSSKAQCQVIRSNDVGFDNNFERQVFTTHMGLSALKSNVKYAAKMRVDQRINGQSIRQLKCIIEKERESHRLIFASLNSYLYRFFGLSDMFVFGKIEDMLLFWKTETRNSYFNLSLNKITLPFDVWPNYFDRHWNESFLNIRYAFNMRFNFGNNPHKDYIEYLKK